eukprot:5065071-Amphidinium_carterae.1
MRFRLFFLNFTIRELQAVIVLVQSCLSRCFNIRQACEYCNMRLTAVQFIRTTSQTLGTKFLFVSFPRLLVLPRVRIFGQLV